MPTPAWQNAKCGAARWPGHGRMLWRRSAHKHTAAALLYTCRACRSRSLIETSQDLSSNGQGARRSQREDGLHEACPVGIANAEKQQLHGASTNQRARYGRDVGTGPRLMGRPLGLLAAVLASPIDLRFVVIRRYVHSCFSRRQCGCAWCQARMAGMPLPGVEQHFWLTCEDTASSSR